MKTMNGHRVSWYKGLCVCVRVHVGVCECEYGTLFNVCNIHFSFVHLPPALNDRRVSHCPKCIFLVHKVGWNVSNLSITTLKQDLKIH